MALTNKIKAIADAIRGKTGKTDGLTLDQMATEIANISATPPTVAQAVPSISVSLQGEITARATQTEGYVVGGTKESTYQLSTQAAKTITPGTSDQTAVITGKYTTGSVKVKGDSNLKAANIAKGVSIFGVTGSLESGGKVATGSFTATTQTLTISGLGFKPTKILLYLMDDTFFMDHLWGDFEWELLYAEYDANATGAFSPVKVVTAGIVESEDSPGDYFFTLEPFQIDAGFYLIPTDDGFRVDCTDGGAYLTAYGDYYYIAIG